MAELPVIKPPGIEEFCKLTGLDITRGWQYNNYCEGFYIALGMDAAVRQLEARDALAAED